MKIKFKEKDGGRERGRKEMGIGKRRKEKKRKLEKIGKK